MGDRGPAAALNGASLISGVPLAYWIDYGFTKMYTQASWRVPTTLQCILTIIGGRLMIFMPNTPRWYNAKMRIEEGDSTLCRLHDEPLDNPVVQQAKREILAVIESELEANKLLDGPNL
ncbi:hypothetical protein PISL3812_04019 [Talaromyces islandicus]|uniref:Uncharacterized protein n=1 Tax=Talaromyces islandicus TaxID=28573 RepID=A0A0U1LW36_TALIS|nr:hypothetical protein PISL3812_04019 [Talaromyces islandicus]